MNRKLIGYYIGSIIVMIIFTSAIGSAAGSRNISPMVFTSENKKVQIYGNLVIYVAIFIMLIFGVASKNVYLSNTFYILFLGLLSLLMYSLVKVFNGNEIRSSMMMTMGMISVVSVAALTIGDKFDKKYYKYAIIALTMLIVTRLVMIAFDDDKLTASGKWQKTFAAAGLVIFIVLMFYDVLVADVKNITNYPMAVMDMVLNTVNIFSKILILNDS